MTDELAEIILLVTQHAIMQYFSLIHANFLAARTKDGSYILLRSQERVHIYFKSNQTRLQDATRESDNKVIVTDVLPSINKPEFSHPYSSV
jgi:hypothetical protein